MLRALGRFLDVNAFRETLVASNMANIDTPGYRTRDVNFQAELARAAGWESSGGDAAPPVGAHSRRTGRSAGRKQRQRGTRRIASGGNAIALSSGNGTGAGPIPAVGHCHQ